MKVFKRFLKNPLSFTGIVLLLLFFFMAAAAPWLAPPTKPCPSFVYYVVPDWLLRPFMKELPCEPFRIPRDGFRAAPLPPDPQAWQTFPPRLQDEFGRKLHPLGTTENRYDIWYGLVWGTRTALIAGILIVGCELLLGLIVGAISGYYGRWVDSFLMRLVDFIFALPTFLMTLVILSIWGRGLDKIVLVSVLFGWAGYARFIRGIILSIREREFISAAKALGANDARIIFRHVLPNSIYPVLILASLDIGSVVLGLSGLSFLGLGQGEDYADWGQMIAFARNRIVGVAGGDVMQYWYTWVFPGMTITLFVFAWNLLGDAVRDILDPRLRGMR
jgi:peptide/nickel transport system permease protein